MTTLLPAIALTLDARAPRSCQLPDEFDQIVAIEPMLQAEVDQRRGRGHDHHRLGRFGRRHPHARRPRRNSSTPVIAQLAVRSEHRVAVHPDRFGELGRRRERIAAPTSASLPAIVRRRHEAICSRNGVAAPVSIVHNMVLVDSSTLAVPVNERFRSAGRHRGGIPMTPQQSRPAPRPPPPTPTTSSHPPPSI